MTSINDILKPKSKEYLSVELNKLSTYEFIYTFRKIKIKNKKKLNLKISFKKRFFYLLIIKSSIKWTFFLMGVLWIIIFLVYDDSLIYGKMIEIMGWILLCFCFPVIIIMDILNYFYFQWEIEFDP